MQFDAVHDTQRVFRALLKAVSFPGSLGSLAREAAGIDAWASVNRALVAVALTLLDAETSFCVWPRNAEAETRLLSQLTYGRPAAPQDALYHFVLRTANAAEALRGASVGTLVEPHLGATVVMEADELTHQGAWTLRGPGINGTASLGVRGLPPEIAAVRAERCAEYPLGIDLFLIDRSGRLAALPRTTRVQVEA